MLIPTAQNTKTVTDMRENAIQLLEDVKKLGLVYLFQHSDPKAVLLSMEKFQQLRGQINDQLDHEDAMNLSNEPRGKLIPLKTALAKYRKSPRRV